MKDNILKTYVRRDLKLNKIKGFTILLTIILSFIFINIMSLYSVSAKLIFQDKLENGHQASFVKIKPEEIEGIKSEESIRKIGIGYIFPEVGVEDINLRIAYMDSELRDLGNVNLIKGDYPKKQDEIIVSENYFKYVNQKADIGDKIDIDLGTGLSTYNLSGILYSEAVGETYPIFVSKEYVDKFGQTDNYISQISMKSPNLYSENELKEKIILLANKYGIEDKNVHFFDMYFYYMGFVNENQYYMILALGLILGLISFLIIHNILYVFALEDRKNIAILRLIGANKKQALYLINTRIRYLGIIGICLGTIGTFSLFFINEKDKLLFLFKQKPIYILIILILSSLYIFFVLKLSAISVKRDINRISAKELFTNSQSTSHLVKRKKNYFITPKFLAWLNVKRDPKKTTYMILSLSIGGILLITSYTFLQAFNPELLAKKSYVNHEISIILKENSVLDSSNDNLMNTIQKKNPIDKDLIHSLKKVNNIEKVEIIQGINAEFISPNGSSDNLNIEGYTTQQEEWIKDNLLEGDSSYQVLYANNGVIVNQPKEIQKYYGWDVKIGDEVKFKYQKKEFKAIVIGITDILTGNGYFYVPAESLYQLADENSNLNYELRLSLKDKSLISQEKTISDVKNLINKYPLKLDTYLNAVDEYKVSLKTSKKLLLSITFIILVMGVGNLINTYLSNIVSRRNEMSLFNLIGMTKSQRSKMLMTENMYYMKRILLITLILGAISSYTLYIFISRDKIIGGMNYKFPIIEFLVYALLIYILGNITLKTADNIFIKQR
ncbi:MAG: ABC transporter permease [Tissierellia bacterium]|nr:ABC transporter permease [Tissierellia bacterium]